MVHGDRITASSPTLVINDRGRWQIVEPLVCASELVTHRTQVTETTTRPNYATFIVGIIGLSLGSIAVFTTASGRDPASSPLLYGGIALAGAGLPFTIGPLIGNDTIVHHLDTGEVTAAPGPSEPCGARAPSARKIALAVGGAEISASLDDRGMLDVSPYDVFDAFAPAATPSELRGMLDGVPLVAAVDPGARRAGAKPFFAAARIDDRIEPARQAATLDAGAVTAQLRTGERGAVVRIALTVTNLGPGPVWQLRGRIAAPATPALDGRMLYGGALASGASRELAVDIPVTAATAQTLAGAAIALAVELSDAHGLAPRTPVRMRARIAGAP